MPPPNSTFCYSLIGEKPTASNTALASGLVAAETLLSALTMPIMVGLAVAFL